MAYELRLAPLGEGVTEATVVRWHKGEGDIVRRGELLLEVMTDKVNVELEAPVSGTLERIGAREDQVVKIGELLALIREFNSEGG